MLHAAKVRCCELHAALALVRAAMLHVAGGNNMLQRCLLHAGLFCMLHAVGCMLSLFFVLHVAD